MNIEDNETPLSFNPIRYRPIYLGFGWGDKG